MHREEKAEFFWNCSVLAVFLLLWMEKYKRIFGDYSGKEVLWGKVGFWTSNSLEFWDVPFYSFCGMEGCSLNFSFQCIDATHVYCMIVINW